MNASARTWTVVLAGPLLWFASFLANFFMSGKVCGEGWKVFLFAVMATALILTAAAGWFAWRVWREAGLEAPGESGGPAGYRRGMGLAGLLLSALFFLVIVAQGVPNILLGGCE